ncbi:MAG: acyltransferase [Bacteroidaceae bacterium]|nr:acyltransferase [Bacteroidaceae bacterium]
MQTNPTAIASAKPRYDILDGLRGVAALMVIVYHAYECFPADTWIIGHGYLAVDFFFILSGFVIGYAYDDRWREGARGRLSVGSFFRRRLIRLHPMVVFGVVLGLVAFLIGGGEAWDGTHATMSAIMWAVLLGLFLIPCAPGFQGDVRGNGEMFSLNGPHWSLFFEYIGNVMYALFIRRFSTKVLGLWTGVLGVVFAWFFVADIVGYGNIGVGWTLDGQNFWGGLLRMTFSYSLGLLMSRLFNGKQAGSAVNNIEMATTGENPKPHNIRGAFWISSLLIVVFLSLPAMGEYNCIYEVVCVMAVFPIILWIGASGATTDSRSTAVCAFLGDISYPLYAVHYPSMYLFYAYIGFPDTWRSPSDCYPWMAALVVGNIVLAYVALKCYDLPVRKWLSKK